MSRTTTTKADSTVESSTSPYSGADEDRNEPENDPLGLDITPADGVDLAFEPWAGRPRWVSKSSGFETFDRDQARLWLMAKNLKHLKT